MRALVHRFIAALEGWHLMDWIVGAAWVVALPSAITALFKENPVPAMTVVAMVAFTTAFLTFVA